MKLREVADSDLDAFFDHQADRQAYEVADVPTRARPAFDVHWARIRGDRHVVIRAIEVDGEVAGHVLSWKRDDGVRLVGYWLGREFWGRGIASEALAAFLEVVRERPLQATVAHGNPASMRVLEKSGFRRLREEPASVVFELR
jgi:RimJ/RimL family protein N-acetyltransferase